MKGEQLVKLGVTIFKVLAWVSLVLQIVIGLILLIGGGPAVEIGGVEIPARVVGVLNCLAGVIYFFLMSLASAVLALLLDMNARLGGRSS